MKTTKRVKYIIQFLLVVMLFQSCTVYKSLPVTLEKAYKSQNNVKIETKDNKTHKFDKLEFNDGQYYGVKKSYKNDEFNQTKKDKILLDQNNISLIKVKNKTMSTVLPFAVPISLIGALLGFYVLD